MFVGPHAEVGGDHKAAAALFPHVIGIVQTAVGRATLERTGGISAQPVAGDPVCQGDVIETAADGEIGIRFIDGTVLNLSHDTRVALSEFVSDSSGASYSALFGVTSGTFAFVAGQAATTGSPRIETPFGSIRGRAHAAGVGMLSLAALVFSALNEVQAADPNATFLDDDNITYKDFAHGKFELVTKEAIPRHIMVEDPGQTVVLSKTGSSVSVNQVTNSPARMEELQALQQDVLANYAKGIGPGGSSTPPFSGGPLPVQPINFVQPEGPAGLNALPALLVTPAVIQETPIVRPPPTAPTFTIASGPVETDTVRFDTFAATGGTFSASSSDNGALTFGISGGTAGSTVLGGAAFDVSETGAFGTLFVNSATGAYMFVPNSDAINALTEPTTQTFVVTVSDGTLSTSQTFTIDINGVNDAAIISGTTTGAVIEAGSAPSNTLSATGTAASGPLGITGKLTDTDVDNTPNTFTAVSTPHASNGGYGTFTMTADGVWTYTLDNANAKVQALNVNDTLTDSFTVTTVDGTPALVTIVIHGTNDAAIVSGGKTGISIEAGGVANAVAGTPIASGKLTDTDVDNTPNLFTAVTSPTASDDGYGTFTMSADGVWTYTLNNANSKVQALNVNDTLTDTFTVTTIDGTPQLITVVIHGSNDAAVISGVTTGSVIEAADCKPGKPVATGKLTDTDIDNAPNTFTAVSTPKESTGGYGTFTMTADGCWTYTLDNTNHAVQALNVCDTLTDCFTVTTIDGTPQLVTITIHGVNDAAIIHGATTGSVTEDGGGSHGMPKATGTLTDTDVDNAPNTFTAVDCPTASDRGFGSFTMTADGVWTYTLDNSKHAIQALNDCDTLTDCFTVTTIDGTAQVVTVTIHGSNDAAIISGVKTGSVTEAAGYKPGKPVATGTLTDTDIDNAPNAFTPVNTPKASTGGYGTFTMTSDGCWTYILDNANHAVQALNVNDTLTDTFRVTTVDGTPQVVTITIHGTNDAAIIHGTTTGSVIEAGCDSYGIPKATGTLTDSDVDNTPNTFTAVDCPTASEGGYGSFTMTAAGVWTYTLDNNNCVVQALNDCDTLTDCFKVTTIDGTAQVITITIHGADDAKYPHHIYEAHADTSIAGISSNGAALAAGSAPAQTTDTGFGLDAVQLSASPDEIQPSSNSSGDQAAITDTSVPPAEPHSDHVAATTEQNFAFAQTPLPGSAGNNSGIAAPNAADDKTAPPPSHVAHDAEPASTAGSWFAPENAGGQSFNFKNDISHLEASDVGLADAGHGPASTDHHGQVLDGHQLLSDGTQTIEPSLPGDHGHDHFNTVPGHTENAVPAQVHHDLMV